MKFFFVTILAILSLLILTVGGQAHSIDISIIKTIPYSGFNPSGITYADGFLWVADCGDSKIYKVNMEDGNTEQTINVDTQSCLNGLTWDSVNSVLILSEFGSGSLIRKIDTTGIIQSSFPTPGVDSTDLAYATHFIYNGDFSNEGLIHKITASDGTLVKTMASPSGSPLGLTYVDEVLWHSDNDNQIYMLDSNCNVLAQGEFPQETGVGVNGLAHDGQYFWASLGGTELIKFQVIINLDMNQPDAFLVLTGSNVYTLKTGTLTEVYGTSVSNNLILQKNSGAILSNFPGENTITIKSESNLFTVSRSGTTVTFQGSDGTVLIIPATATEQAIIFNDQWLNLVIDNGDVLLGGQVISTQEDSIN